MPGTRTGCPAHRGRAEIPPSATGVCGRCPCTRVANLCERRVKPPWCASTASRRLRPKGDTPLAPAPRRLWPSASAQPSDHCPASTWWPTSRDDPEGPSIAVAHPSTNRMRWRTTRAVSALTCQIGVRISSTSVVLTGRGPPGRSRGRFLEERQTAVERRRPHDVAITDRELERRRVNTPHSACYENVPCQTTGRAVATKICRPWPHRIGSVRTEPVPREPGWPQLVGPGRKGSEPVITHLFVYSYGV